MRAISTSSLLIESKINHHQPSTDLESITRDLIPGQKYTFNIKNPAGRTNATLGGHSKIRTYLGLVMLEGQEHVEVERVACKSYLIAVENIESITAAQ